MAAPNVNSNVETRTMCVISTSFECNPREREREKKGARLKYSRRRFRTGPSGSQGDILRRLAESRKSSWVPGEDSRAKERGRERDEGGSLEQPLWALRLSFASRAMLEVALSGGSEGN